MEGLSKESIQIREVQNHNLEEEFALIRDIVDDYPYVAMASDSPGVVIRIPEGTFKSISEYNYRTLKENVDELNLSQLSLTFCDEKGNLPTCGTDKLCIWQFNFRELERNQFAHLLMSSGIVINDGIKWVSFHGGHDFGYLLKLMTGNRMPETQAGFFSLINIYFPNLYDIKHLSKFCNGFRGGLNELAELLDVERVGISNQVGSDSLLICCTFIKLQGIFFDGSAERYAGVLYGLGIEDGLG